MDYIIFFIGFFIGALTITLIVKHKQKKAQEQLMFQEQRRPKKPYTEVFSEEVEVEDYEKWSEIRWLTHSTSL